jgi:hypothetical protein
MEDGREFSPILAYPTSDTLSLLDSTALFIALPVISLVKSFLMNEEDNIMDGIKIRSPMSEHRIAAEPRTPKQTTGRKGEISNMVNPKKITA